MQVSMDRKGTLGACAGVIYTDGSELMYQWFNHHTLLGVEGFDVYWTNSSISPEKDQKESVPSPFPYPGVRWVQFRHLTLQDRHLYSQTTMRMIARTTIATDFPPCL